jgi:predicted site-specific integrase-resolvase
MNANLVNLSKLRTTAQAGKALGLSTDTVKIYCNTGKLAGIKIGNNWMIAESEIKRYQKNRIPAGRPKKSE